MKNQISEFRDSSMARWRDVLILVFFGCAVWISCLYVFSVYPNVDMSVTTFFYSPEGHFSMRAELWVRTIRRSIIYALVVFYVVALFAGLHSWKKMIPVLRLSWDKWLYLGFSAMLGTVMLINVLLKGNWGRARPQDVIEFGGAAEFTPFWEWADQCRDNCSFASGEVAGVATVFFSLALLVGGKSRWALFIAGLVLSAGTAVLRVMMGSHFLSDTIMAIGLMAITTGVSYAILYLVKHSWLEKLEKKSPARTASSA